MDQHGLRTKPRERDQLSVSEAAPIRRTAPLNQSPTKRQESSSSDTSDDDDGYRMGDELWEEEPDAGPTTQIIVESDLDSDIDSDDGRRRYEMDDNVIPAEVPAPVTEETEEQVEVHKALPTPRDPPSVSKKIKKKADAIYEEEEPPAPPTRRSITRLSSEEQAQLGLPNSEEYIQEVLKTHRRKPVAQKLKIVVSQKDREIQRLQQQVQRLEDEKRQMMEVAQSPVVSSQPEPPIQMSNTHLTTGVERVVDRSTTGQSASQNQVALATVGAQPHTPDFEQPVDSGRRQGRSHSPQQRSSYRKTFSS